MSAKAETDANLEQVVTEMEHDLEASGVDKEEVSHSAPCNARYQNMHAWQLGRMLYDWYI